MEFKLEWPAERLDAVKKILDLYLFNTTETQRPRKNMSPGDKTFLETRRFHVTKALDDLEAVDVEAQVLKTLESNPRGQDQLDAAAFIVVSMALERLADEADSPTAKAGALSAPSMAMELRRIALKLAPELAVKHL